MIQLMSLKLLHQDQRSTSTLSQFCRSFQFEAAPSKITPLCHSLLIIIYRNIFANHAGSFLNDIMVQQLRPANNWGQSHPIIKGAAQLNRGPFLVPEHLNSKS